MLAADLQEPPELIVSFFRALSSEPFDITIGVRAGAAAILDAVAPGQLLSGSIAASSSRKYRWRRRHLRLQSDGPRLLLSRFANRMRA